MTRDALIRACAERAIFTSPKYAALADGDLAGEALCLWDVNGAVRVVTVGLIGCSNDQSCGRAEHVVRENIGIGDGEYAAVIRVTAQAVGAHRTTGWRECVSREGAVP